MLPPFPGTLENTPMTLLASRRSPFVCLLDLCITWKFGFENGVLICERHQPVMQCSLTAAAILWFHRPIIFLGRA